MNTQKIDHLRDTTPDKFIFGSIHVLANKIQMLADKGPGDISFKQWLLLIMIMQFYGEAPTLSEVAEEIGSSRQNVKQLALKLEAKGLLRIEKDKKDARILRLHICEGCEEYFSDQRDYQENFLKLLYKDLTLEEIRVMAKGIYKMSCNIMEMENLVKQGGSI